MPNSKKVTRAQKVSYLNSNSTIKISENAQRCRLDLGYVAQCSRTYTSKQSSQRAKEPKRDGGILANLHTPIFFGLFLFSTAAVRVCIELNHFWLLHLIWRFFFFFFFFYIFNATCHLTDLSFSRLLNSMSECCCCCCHASTWCARAADTLKIHNNFYLHLLKIEWVTSIDQNYRYRTKTGIRSGEFEGADNRRVALIEEIGMRWMDCSARWPRDCLINSSLSPSHISLAERLPSLRNCHRSRNNIPFTSRAVVRTKGLK